MRKDLNWATDADGRVLVRGDLVELDGDPYDWKVTGFAFKRGDLVQVSRCDVRLDIRLVRSETVKTKMRWATSKKERAR